MLPIYQTKDKKQMIHFLEENGYEFHYLKVSLFSYSISEEVIDGLLEELQSGKLDCVLEYPYWYGGVEPYFGELLLWKLYRMGSDATQEITKENYAVFFQVMRWIPFVMNQEERKTFQNMMSIVIEKNYHWQDGICLTEKMNQGLLMKSITSMDLSIFQPQPVLKNLPSSFSKRNKEKIQEQVRTVLKSLDTLPLSSFFQDPSKTGLEEYTRRMMLSQLDISKMIFNRQRQELQNPLFDSERLLEQQQLISCAIQELNESQSTTYSESLLQILFGNTQAQDNSHSNQLINDRARHLMRGVLFSLTGEEKIIDLEEKCEAIQENYNIPIRFGTRYVRKIGEQQIKLSSGSVVASIDPLNIPSFFKRWQCQYETLYQEGSPAEFIKGCTQIMSEMILSLPFRTGNKRTAKALFNAMVVSRGLLPPVLDFCQKNYQLFHDVVKSFENHFDQISQKALLLWKQQMDQFQKDEYFLPIVIQQHTIRPPSSFAGSPHVKKQIYHR